MRPLQPSQVFVAGSAGLALTTGIYLSGYPIFLWRFLGHYSDLKLPLTIIVSIIGGKLFLEFLFDIITSLFADFLPNYGRRKMVLLATFVQLIGFVILSCFMLWSHTI